jgi:hypothetical protein
MFRRRRSADDFAEEIKSHIELQADALHSEGLSVSAGAKIPIVPVENSPAPQASGVNPESGRQRRVETCLGAKTWKRSMNSSERV